MINLANRNLIWDACYNVRDLGGFSIIGGGQTRWRAVVRSDNLSRLSAHGRAALQEYGVKTIVDLRSPDELLKDLNPFSDTATYPSGPYYRSLPLIGAQVDFVKGALATATSTEGLYRDMLDTSSAGFVSVLEAVADSPDGVVVIHCHAGKDRTGLVTALLLDVVGVPRAEIALDYAVSAANMKPIMEHILSRYPQDPDEQARIRALFAADPETILDILDYLDGKYGGSEPYLLSSGLTGEAITRLRRRLIG